MRGAAKKPHCLADLRRKDNHLGHSTTGQGRRGLQNMRLLLTRFGLVGKGRSPCSDHPSATSIAAQQNR